MKRLITGALLATLALGAQALPILKGTASFTAPLSGSQEVPPNNSPGTGTAQVTVDDTGDRDPDTNLLSWNVSFSGLASNFLSAHFHGPAQPGENAGIQVPITDSLAGSPDIAGQLVGSANISLQQFKQLQAGKWYINIHSVQIPSGEIRGQVIPAAVPEPSSLALLGLALAGLGSLRRRVRVA